MLNLYKDNFFKSQTKMKQSPTDKNDEDENSEEELIKPVRTKLYVSNFPLNSTRRQLTEFFNKFGNVLECAIMWDSYAFIHYASRKEASNALKIASTKRFKGNKLFIQLSISRNRQESNWYKKEVEKLEIQLFSSSLENGKSPISPNSNNLINETKLFVTNLPDNCNQVELKSLFQKYGKVLECVVMWNHYAFVHYSDVLEARNGQMNLHGYLLEGKHLIVQFSTTSNRPLPKCKVFESNNKTRQQNGLEFIKNYESSFVSGGDQQPPATILCYRASDLELSEETTTTMKKDWIKILSQGWVSIFEQKLSLSDIPTPDTPTQLLSTKILPSADSYTNYEEFQSLDQIPTPPLPAARALSSVDISDYPISSSSESVSPFSCCLDDDDDDEEDIFQLLNTHCCW